MRSRTDIAIDVTPAAGSARVADPVRWVPALLLVAAGLGVIALLTPAAGLVPPCTWRALTGTYCPGCGTGRAIQALSRGDLLAALRLNQLLLLFVPFALYGAISWVLRRRSIASLPRLLDQAWFGPVVLVLIVAYWVVRNVPIYPLTLLAPH